MASKQNKSKQGSSSQQNEVGRQGSSQGSKQSGSGSGSRSGSSGNSAGSGGTRGGTPEQHAEAGRQSHKNDKNR